jgi:acetyl-CoA C-acetyltransferase
VRDVYIVGVGQTPVNRDPASRGRDLAVKAVHQAMADAGLPPDRIDALYVGNMMSGILERQQQLGGLIADYAGLGGLEGVTVEAACASGGAAARLAYQMVAGGIHDVVLVCGLEQMTHVDRQTVTQALATAADWQLEGTAGESFLSLNARLMRDYMQHWGVAQKAFAPFSVTAHHNALTNPNALLHKDVSIETYLESRVIIDPLRLYDVSPLCNGAAAIVLASAEGATRLEAQRHPAVRIAASAAATAPVALARRSSTLELDAVRRSTQDAFAQARITHQDIDAFELHDAYTIMSVLTLESAGFAEPGTGTELGRDGRISLTGELPISTMGGLKARGHPVGATGVYQLADAYMQLTGTAGPNQIEDARVMLVQNIGGTGATVITHVLRREG